MMHLLISLILPAQIGAAGLPPDSVAELRQQARSAEARFERLSRQRAPTTFRTFSGTSCDEIVGRFCLRFDSTVSLPDAEEDERVDIARSAAVEAARRYFSAVPGARDAAGPLVRLLIADGRAAEAVPAARAFAALGADTLWAQLLLGLALHAAGADSSAEVHFARGLAALAPEERRRWLEPEWLIDPRERNLMRRLPEAERAELERRFWISADPFWLTSANEIWVEHIARWVQARLLAEVPRVADLVRWGRDLDELTIRYGVPVARTRSRGPPGSMRSSLVEHWDTAQRAYMLERPSVGVSPQPPPGQRPLLYAARTRSAYAWTAVSRVLELPHQTARFLDGDDVVLRIDGVISASGADAESRPTPVGAIVYDSSFGVRTEVGGRAAWQADSARFSLLIDLPPGRVVYSVEALDTAADLAFRSRHAVESLAASPATPVLSDLLIAQPFGRGAAPERFDDDRIAAHASLIFARGDTLGVYAEAYRIRSQGAGAVGIELSLEPLDRPSMLNELARWIGRTIGIVGERTSPSISWRTEAAGVTHTIAFDLPLDPRLRGRYALILRVTDADSGIVAESRREILIDERQPPA